MFLHITLLLQIFFAAKKNTALNAEQSVKKHGDYFLCIFG